MAVRALPADGKPGAPVRHLVLDAEPEPIAEAGARARRRERRAGGACSGSATRRAHRTALAEHLSELTPLERANLLADTWATTLAGIRRSRSSCAWPPASATSPSPPPGPPSPARSTLTKRITPPQQEDALAPGRARADRSHPPPARLRRRTRARATARRRCARSPSTSWGPSAPIPTSGRGRPPLRRLAHRRRHGDPIPPDVESATLAVVAQLLRPGDYDALLERYRTASTPQEEMRSLGALAGFPDVDLCLRTFDLAMTEVRSQNGFAVLGSLLANSVGNQAVWTRLTENWDAVLERFPKNAPPRIIESIPALCGDAEFAEGAIAFLDDHPLASGPRRVAQSVERLRVNVAFGARERAGSGRHRCGRRRRVRRLDGRTSTRPATTHRRLGARAVPLRDGPPDPGLHARRRGRGALRRRPAGRASGCPGGCARRPSWRSAPGAGSRPCTWVPPPRPPARRCSPSTTTAARRRTSPAGSTTSPIWSIPRWAASTRCRTGGAPSPGPASSHRSWGSWATPPPWRRAGTVPSPSASSTAGTARSPPGPTSAAGRPTSPSADGWPSTTCSPTRPTAAARPTSCTAPPLDSGEFVDDGACGSLRVLRRVALPG